eukprot:TRINITY_DN9766_c0_g1_i9.p2 TRINITY_DN9766_c0_g1~~TRINITY_DN9766_c0_g1_i9.p2  ORF type:complete len:185 (-),score=24.80 TRINITY_DN9766_c0_g1_i9:105-659(-)
MCIRDSDRNENMVKVLRLTVLALLTFIISCGPKVRMDKCDPRWVAKLYSDGSTCDTSTRKDYQASLATLLATYLEDNSLPCGRLSVCNPTALIGSIDNIYALETVYGIHFLPSLTDVVALSRALGNGNSVILFTQSKGIFLAYTRVVSGFTAVDSRGKDATVADKDIKYGICLLYTSPSPRDQA